MLILFADSQNINASIENLTLRWITANIDFTGAECEIEVGLARNEVVALINVLARVRVVSLSLVENWLPFQLIVEVHQVHPEEVMIGKGLDHNTSGEVIVGFVYTRGRKFIAEVKELL